MRDKDAQLAHILDELERTEHYIYVAEEHVAQQWHRVAMGRIAPSFSTAVLRSLEDALLSFRNHRDLLKRALYEADGAQPLEAADRHRASTS
jgi:hypothetical protein